MRDGVTGCARTCARTVGRQDSGSQGQWVARQWVAKVTQLESHPAVVMAVTTVEVRKSTRSWVMMNGQGLSLTSAQRAR